MVKIILPKNEYDVMWRDLKRMNISSASLFPDLAGFARSLHHRLPGKPQEPAYKPSGPTLRYR